MSRKKISTEIARNSNLIKIDFFVVHNDKQQRRDKVLNEFCELHKDKVTLIRFKYDEMDELIIKLLNKTFNS